MSSVKISFVSFLVFFISQIQVASTKSPHIVFIVADDLGWNDIGWHNKDILTPNLDKLALEGVILNNSYVQYICSPSRGAFMSGYYPYHSGLQHGVIRPQQPHGLPTNFSTIAERMKEAGYATHIVGKWHLGFCKWSFTPTYRGFDSFHGYYVGSEDYYEHTRNDGYDFRHNKDVDKSVKGKYSANIFGDRAISIIENHDVSTPLFLYLPFQSVHAPLQVPKQYEDMYKHIDNKDRRIKSGMVTAMDEAVGNVTKALQEKGMMDETLIVFTTDNGGPIMDAANNWPLRGSKHTLWEGGHRAAAFVWGKMLAKKKYTNNGMIHAVDWFPTFQSVAGLEPDTGIDGVNQWNTISANKESPRTEFVYNIDEIDKRSAIRVGDYKLIEGNAGEPSGWYPPPSYGDRYDKLDETYYPQKTLTYQLFDVQADPTEHHDLAKSMPDVLEKMKDKLKQYKASAVPAFFPPYDPKSDPKHWGGNWSPGWC